MDYEQLFDGLFNFFNIVVMDILLSGENALLIGLAARRLPAHQRQRVIFFGIGLAVVLRIVLTLLATYLLTLPWLRCTGGVLLLFIAAKLLVYQPGTVESSPSLGEEEKQTTTSWRAAVGTILLADVVMSLDNVLAIAGVAHGSPGLAAFGLILSIPLVVGGSQWIIKLLELFPRLDVVGAALLGFAAGRLLAEESFIADFLQWFGFGAVVGLYTLSILFPLGGGWLWRRWSQQRATTRQEKEGAEEQEKETQEKETTDEREGEQVEQVESQK